MKNILKAMGLVFGDIGTSPIYTFTVIFLTTAVTFENIVSILSLIIWTLLLIVTVQYSWLAMSLSKRGEGGTIVLNEILRKFLKSSKAIAFFSFLTYLGVSLLIGDSVITPAISILSAVEGTKLISTLSSISQEHILVITMIISIVLFSVQHYGTEKITKIFGPVMFVWFLALGLSGLAYVIHCPAIFAAFNPLHGINFLLHHGFAGFFVLSEVILCATGAEALYADMGHLGRAPIIKAWGFVLCVLLFNYLGQGVFLIKHPDSQNILFSMVLNLNKHLYIPFLITSLLATIIASQAMISGLFSIVFQGVNTRILPLFKIEYTSEKINTQIYIPAANWFLLFFVVIVILFFKQSSSLAAAYGLAVTGTITLTSIIMGTIFLLKKKYVHFGLSVLLLMLDLFFFVAACMKIPHGAYWSIIIAAIPLLLIVLYTNGNRYLYSRMKSMNKNEFLEKYNHIYNCSKKIRGTALFFARGLQIVPQYIIQTMLTDNIVFEHNIFVQVVKSGNPFEINYKLSNCAPGLQILEIKAGYMQKVDIHWVLKKMGIREKVIFYGVEEVETEKFIWKLFATIKKITPTFVSYYKLPLDKVRGVITRINM